MHFLGEIILDSFLHGKSVQARRGERTKRVGKGEGEEGGRGWKSKEGMSTGNANNPGTGTGRGKKRNQSRLLPGDFEKGKEKKERKNSNALPGQEVRKFPNYLLRPKKVKAGEEGGKLILVLRKDDSKEEEPTGTIRAHLAWARASYKREIKYRKGKGRPQYLKDCWG